VALVVDTALSAPQAGEQATPDTIKVHVTPAFVVSFCTDAVKVTAAALAAIVVILLAMVTEMGAVPMLETVPQPVAHRMLLRAVTNKYTRIVQAKLHELMRMARPLH